VIGDGHGLISDRLTVSTLSRKNVGNQVSRSLSRDLKPDTKQVFGLKQSPQWLMYVIILFRYCCSSFYWSLLPVMYSCLWFLFPTCNERRSPEDSHRKELYYIICACSLNRSLSLFGPWPVFQFLNPIHRGSPPQGLYLHTEQTRTDTHASSGIQTHDPSVRAGEEGSCLRPRSHCDRPHRTVRSV
jgi:hypothetical protein